MTDRSNHQGDTTRPNPSAAVAERLIIEGLISLEEAAKLLPRKRDPLTGVLKTVSTSSIFRWIVKGKSGTHLEAIRLVGGGWQTSRAALARFAAAVTWASCLLVFARVVLFVARRGC